MARERAQAAEEKAARLLNLSLVLLGVSLGVTKTLLAAWTPLDLFMVPSWLSIFFFALSAMGAWGIDHVGKYIYPEHTEDPISALSAEDLGAQAAQWTADRKLDDLLQARAWLTRGFVALLIAALLIVLGEPAGADHNLLTGPW